MKKQMLIIASLILLSGCGVSPEPVYDCTGIDHNKWLEIYEQCMPRGTNPTCRRTASAVLCKPVDTKKEQENGSS